MAEATFIFRPLNGRHLPEWDTLQQAAAVLDRRHGL